MFDLGENVGCLLLLIVFVVLGISIDVGFILMMHDLDLELGWILILPAFQSEMFLKVGYCLRGKTLVDKSTLNHKQKTVEFIIDLGVWLMDCH